MHKESTTALIPLAQQDKLGKKNTETTAATKESDVCNKDKYLGAFLGINRILLGIQPNPQWNQVLQKFQLKSIKVFCVGVMVHVSFFWYGPIGLVCKCTK